MEPCTSGCHPLLLGHSTVLISLYFSHSFNISFAGSSSSIQLLKVGIPQARPSLSLFTFSLGHFNYACNFTYHFNGGSSILNPRLLWIWEFRASCLRDIFWVSSKSTQTQHCSKPSWWVFPSHMAPFQWFLCRFHHSSSYISWTFIFPPLSLPSSNLLPSPVNFTFCFLNFPTFHSLQLSSLS